MKKLQLTTNKFNDLNLTLESPFCETNGLLEFKEGFTEPEFFVNWSFVTNLYGEQVQVDHCVLTLADLPSLENYAKGLLRFNVRIVEGLGLFPLEFCSNTYTLTTDLWLHLLTILMPSGGLLVLVAPHAAGDQLERFLHKRGMSAVHHVAIRVEDVYTAAWMWQEKGFHPMSEEPLVGGSLGQWFLQNFAGQIIELIYRQSDNNSTFYCQNVGGLRLAEVAQKG